jgi:hypothetical protein
VGWHDTQGHLDFGEGIRGVRVSHTRDDLVFNTVSAAQGVENPAEDVGDETGDKQDWNSHNGAVGWILSVLQRLFFTQLGHRSLNYTK